MSQNHVDWLMSEIKGWRARGLVTQEVVDAIAAHYSAGQQAGRSRSILLLVFGILGALLIGGGLILLIAHNWSELPRAVRTIAAFLPVLAGQYACWYALRHGKGAGWREAAATFLTLALGGALALIGQMYHIGGTLGGFLLTWMLLALPLVYLLESQAVLGLYLAGITGWAVYTRTMHHDMQHDVYWVWPLIACAGYKLWRIWPVRTGGGGPFVFFVLSLCLPINLGVILQEDFFKHSFPYLAALIAAIYVLADGRDPESPALSWRHPMNRLGTLFILALSLGSTFAHFTRELKHECGLQLGRINGWSPDVVIACLILVGAVLLLVRGCIRRRWMEVYYAGFAFLFLFTGFLDEPGVDLILFNAYFFALGVVIILTGWRALHIGMVNGGMVVMAIWIGARFFDVHMSFMLRGILFIILGACFLTANIMLARRRRASQPAQGVEVTP